MQSSSKTGWSLKLLGRPEVRVGGRVVDLGDRDAELLGLLAAHRGTPVSREKLADHFWSGSPTPEARSNLRVALLRLRARLGAAGRHLSAGRGPVLLDMDSARLDTARLDAAIQLAREGRYLGHLKVVALGKRGSLLADYRLNEWPALMDQRAHYEQAYLSSVASVSKRWLEQGRLDAAQALLEGAATSHRLHEPTHRLLMRVLREKRELNAALKLFRGLVYRTRAELGTSLSEETKQLHQEIVGEYFSAAVGPQRAQSPTVDYRPGGEVPQPPQPLLGRERERQSIEVDLRRSRLVVIQGEPGIGKTRLAIEVANRMAPEFTDGACFFALADLTGADQIPPLINWALMQEESAAEPVQRLIDILRPMGLLLVLDNCEHLLPNCAQLVELLVRNCPGVHVLATSRAAFRMDEVRRRIFPLELPPASIPPTPEGLGTLESSPATRLFLDELRRLDQDGSLGPEDAPCIAGICRRLEGLPGSIVLAASRANILTVTEISRSIQNLLKLRQYGYRDEEYDGEEVSVPRVESLDPEKADLDSDPGHGGYPFDELNEFPDGGPGIAARERRQRVLRPRGSLRAMIDWSYQLLGREEQRMFRVASTFAGGFDAAAADHVYHRTAGPVPHDTLELLSGIESSSLIRKQVTPDRESRYGMLETLRLFGVSVIERDEWEVVSRAHLEYFMHLAACESRRYHTETELLAVARLSAEEANIRVALERVLGGERTGQYSEDDRLQHLCMVTNLCWFWYVRGQAAEATRWLRSALSHVQKDCRYPEVRVVALALGREAWLTTHGSGRSSHCDLLAGRSVAIARRSGDREALAEALWIAAYVILSADGASNERASRYLDESLVLAREAGDAYREAAVLLLLAWIAHANHDLETAGAFLAECEGAYHRYPVYSRLGSPQYRGKEWQLGKSGDAQRADWDWIHQRIEMGRSELNVWL